MNLYNVYQWDICRLLNYIFWNVELEHLRTTATISVYILRRSSGKRPKQRYRGPVKVFFDYLHTKREEARIDVTSDVGYAMAALNPRPILLPMYICGACTRHNVNIYIANSDPTPRSGDSRSLTSSKIYEPSPFAASFSANVHTWTFV